MGLLVIGSGLAGLAVAIDVKEAAPRLDVLLVEKHQAQSNTQLSGMRLRGGITNRRQDASAEILELLTQRNDGVETIQMRRFAELAAAELDAWQRRPAFVAFEDRREWFGPQWGAPNRAGKGHGKSVLDWLRATASDRGVRLATGEALRLEIDRGRVRSVRLRLPDGGLARLHVEAVVVAAGTAGGALFVSTNKRIRGSSHALAYEAGLPLVDSTLHMIHPFANVHRGGAAGLGCFETDKLAGAEVFAGVSDGQEFRHELGSELLARHQAHYHFPELAREFARHGAIVRLRHPDGREHLARVSHHYHHLAIDTTDGVQVRGVENLFAAGDASGLGHWTNHRERFPGFALLKCLVDGALIAREAANLTPGCAVGWEPLVSGSGSRQPEPSQPAGTGDDDNEDRLRELNSELLTRVLETTGEKRCAATERWLEAIRAFGERHRWTTLTELSLAMAWAHRERFAHGRSEPICIDAARVARLRAPVGAGV